jgi:hypothetical protein
MAKWVTILIGAAVLAGPAPQAFGAEDRPVTLQVQVIRATTSNSDIAAELGPLAEQLKRQFKFTGYQLVSRTSRTVKAGEALTVPLPSGYEAKLTPQKRTSDRIQLQVEVTQQQGDRKAPKLRTTVAMTPDKATLFGGMNVSGGSDVLILAVSAK